MALISDWGGEEAFIKKENEYTNKQLEKFLVNRSQFVVEWNNRLVRKFSPIYLEPLSNYGRAHFYAPHKKLGNVSINTYWFNLIIIWLSAYIYYILLSYDLLRKFTNWNRVRRLRRNR